MFGLTSNYPNLLTTSQNGVIIIIFFFFDNSLSHLFYPLCKLSLLLPEENGEQG